MSKKYRLLTRSDFDGIVCAVLLKEMGILDEIKFVHPQDMQDGKVDVSSNDITTNVPYVEGVHLAFDHHLSEAARPGHEALRRRAVTLSAALCAATETLRTAASRAGPGVRNRPEPRCSALAFRIETPASFERKPGLVNPPAVNPQLAALDLHSDLENRPEGECFDRA